ncbi:MAG: hypothetical protein N4A33_12305 [Bacteriovoracaceae bacterium]|jgi:hypothetical protein|nr:hypothetical protein [Bacteriovoracaceae bacterium]
MNIRIGGVYDSGTILALKGLGISHFKFDLRPTSINFTQIKLVEALISKDIEHTDSIYLSFDRDNEVTIAQTVLQLEHCLSGSRFALEFYNCNRGVEFYEQFDLPYILHIDHTFKPETLSFYTNCIGISLANRSLEQLKNFSNIHLYLKEIINNKSQRAFFEVFLNWKESLDVTILDFYGVNQFSFDIDQDVESSFRKVNMTNLKTNLISFQANVGRSYENIINK